MGSKKSNRSAKSDVCLTQKTKVIEKQKDQQKQTKLDDMDIDDIFNTSKKQKQQQQQQQQQQQLQQQQQQQQLKQQSQNINLENKNDIFGEQSSSGRKKTEEGYAIYTEEELGFRDNCGDTDLCPFDCDCCF
eukprot:TRINITY_DN742_c0_g7_i1.p2 TRINITY_DN742_c0_g7~~TRINITY_DN742_c0_g7_i1.p2  ORF type:complete len:132 (-),score=29.02 TRINITY_DN742_c0_g7_i1:322-717(-)